MNLLFNSEKNNNDKNEGNEFYFFNSTDDLANNLEFDRKSYTLEMSYNLDHKISDFEVSYEDFKIFQNPYSTLKNGDQIYYTENYKSLPDLNEKYKSNIFLKRTWLDRNEKPFLDKDIIRDFPNHFSINYKMKIKRENTKLLLLKTRRNTDHNSSTSEGKDNDFQSDKYSSHSFFGKGESSITDKSIKKKNKPRNKEFNYTAKKEILKQKNREAAQRSRKNKKFEYDYLIQNQNLLKEENKNLKDELNKYTSKSYKYCEKCKKNLIEESASNKINNPKEKIVDIKNFKVNHPTRIIQNSLVSSDFNTRTGKLTLFTTLLVIICIFVNVFWFNTENSVNKSHYSKLSGRLMMGNINNTNSKENSINKEIYKKVFDVKKIQNFPPVLIDDNHDSKSFYLLFMDYIKSRTGFTPSTYSNINSTFSEINLKNQFLPKIENNNFSNKNACLNNITFLKFTTDFEPHQHSKEDKKEKFLRTNLPNLTFKKDLRICNTTKFTGYFDLEFSKLNPRNKIDKYKEFNSNSKQEQKTEK